MRKITVAALGPGAPEHLTLGTLKAMEEARAIILRTGRHGTAGELQKRGIPFSTLDELYDGCEDFGALNEKAVQTLWEAAAAGPVLYGVADPAGDETVRALMSSRSPHDQVEVLPGVSIMSQCLNALQVLPGACPVRSVPACACEGAVLLPTEPMLITELNSRLLTGQVKLWLLTLYAPEQKVIFFPCGEEARRKTIEIPLSELDRQKAYDHTTAVYVPAAPLLDRSRNDFFDLMRVMEILRGPEGCPWDREQTHETLRPYLLEEAYEAVSAIDEGDLNHVADELGDVLLQVVFHAQIAKQHGEFDIHDITSAICQKMISRHAHIFGSDQCKTSDDVLKNWDKLKKKERGLDTQAAVMADVPHHLPALMRAAKVQQKAKQVGFDWDDPREALKKVLEEVEEVRETLEEGIDPGEELGDLLFAAVNAVRLCGKQGELVLNSATEKFIRRFSSMEKAILADGKALELLTLSEMDVYWEEGKTLEKKA